MDPKKKRTKIEIPSDILYVAKVSKKILKFLRDHKLKDAHLFDVRLCIEEALKNAIDHGNKCNKSLPVKVSLCISDDELVIEVEDRGAGFDFKNLPDPTLDENIMLEKGRGVFLIRHLMDEVNFNYKGNKITMVKKLK